MKTGEGKTLVSTLPAYLNALTGRGVHVVTVNDYLAKETLSGWEKYLAFGITTGCITNELNDQERQKNYSSDYYIRNE